MLKMSDISIDAFIPMFANTGTDVAFLVPTETGYKKSIMDAIAPVRELLKEKNIHNYETQNQGPDFKIVLKSFFVYANRITETSVSLYRPITKNGDPRIWFKGLKNYCKPFNLLALTIIDGCIYVINLSENSISDSLKENGYIFNLLNDSNSEHNKISDELLKKIKDIHDKGFIESITSGDPGVGDTLENALGISRNNIQAPDYKGIELKTTRLTRNNTKRQTTRITLFTKVPDTGCTYREILDNYGKLQIPNGKTEERLQIYDTLKSSRPNAYGLFLEVDSNKNILKIMYKQGSDSKFVSSWNIKSLQEVLLSKHHETFWVKASSKTLDGIEYFRYDKILHTKNPNASLLAPLIESDIITIDLAAHYNPNGKYKDHGVLFKISPDKINLLFGEPVEYDLN